MAVSWLPKDNQCSVVCLHEKPGAGQRAARILDKHLITFVGKSVLSANLVQHLEETSSDVCFYFRSYSDTIAGTSVNLFRSLVAQIVQAHPDTVSYTSENFINLHKTSHQKYCCLSYANCWEQSVLRTW